MRRRWQSIHSEAMEHTRNGIASRNAGRDTEALAHFEKAYRLEREAATSFKGDPLTRSILYRSAATLALDSHHYEDVRTLVQAGLEGAPPPGIQKELEGVLKLAAEAQVSAAAAAEAKG